MTYVAVAAIFTATIALLLVSALCRVIVNMERRHGRRVDSLLDRLAHAHGRTWTPPPAEDEKPEEPVPDYDFGADHDPELLT